MFWGWQPTSIWSFSHRYFRSEKTDISAGLIHREHLSRQYDFMCIHSPGKYAVYYLPANLLCVKIRHRKKEVFNSPDVPLGKLYDMFYGKIQYEKTFDNYIRFICFLTLTSWSAHSWRFLNFMWLQNQAATLLIKLLLKWVLSISVSIKNHRNHPLFLEFLRLIRKW